MNCQVFFSILRNRKGLCRLYLLLFLCFTGITSAYGQDKNKISVIAKSFIDSVVVRWAPSNALSWQACNQYGYIVKRTTIMRKGKVLAPDFEDIILTKEPVRPYTKELFAQKNDTSPYVLLAYQAMYGEKFLPVAKAKGILQMINKAKELDDRFSFALMGADQSPAAAKAQGLWFTDRNVNKDEKYSYTIIPVVPKSILNIDSGFVFVDMLDTFKLPKPYDFKITFGNHQAILSWNKELLGRIYVHYIVERSDDGGKTFHELKRLPVLNPEKEENKKIDRRFMSDSLPMNGFTYKYRIKGKTLFGEIGPYSSVLEGNGFESGEQMNPKIVGYDISPDNKVVLKWGFTHKDSVYVMGFDVLRANKNEGPYVKLNKTPLSPSYRVFIDSFPNSVNYYRINALDKEGKVYPSFTTMVQKEDTVPPAVPKNVIGSIDSLGLVHLMWDENNEPDLASYRIFKANNPDAPFIKVNNAPVLSNAYVDTTILKTLSSYIYYRIAALDQHYNQSEYSEILKLKRPDIVPPAEASFINCEANDSSVILSWYPSPSIDVAKHVLYRQKAGDSSAVLIAVIDSANKKNRYVDSTAADGGFYKYILIAVDESGLESEPVYFTLQIPRKNNRNAIYDFVAFMNYDEKGIELRWQCDFGNIENFQIYRAVVGGALTRYRVVGGNENIYLDKNIVKETSYKYSIQAVFTDGSRSRMAEQVQAKY